MAEGSPGREPEHEKWPKRSTWMRPFIEEPFDNVDVDFKARRRAPLFAISLCLLLTASFALQLVTALQFPSGIAPTVLLGLATLVLIVVRPRTAPIPVAVLLAVALPLQVALLSSQWRIEAVTCAVSAGLALVALILLVNMPLRDPSLPRAGISQAFTEPKKGFRSPEDDLTLWQWMSVSWMSPLISAGYKRQLHDEDVWSLGYVFQHHHLHNAFRELRGTVVRRLIRANWHDLAALSVLAIVDLAANYFLPVLLQYLLQSMEKIHETKRPAITYAVLMLAFRAVDAQSSVLMMWFGRRCYERSRGEMITMLYEKTLNRKIIGGVQNEEPAHDTPDDVADPANGLVPDDETDAGPPPEDAGLLNGHTKQSEPSAARLFGKARDWMSFMSRKKTIDTEKQLPASTGKILNLMRNDVYEVAQRFWEFQLLVNKPLGLVFSFVLVWRLIGWPCLVGIAVVLVGQVINVVLARALISWEKERRKATDAKLQHISQFVEAIRHLRWYGWHPTWLNRIMEARQKELNLRIVTYLWNSAIVFNNILSSGLLPAAAFWAYTTLAKQELRIDIAFPAMELFNLLQTDLKEIPRLITTLLNAAVAVGRIEDFMSEPDKAKVENRVDESEGQLEFEHASFAWPGLSQSVLKDVTLSFPPGLTVIFGQVASGKTALLQALLGELDLQDGVMRKPNAPVAYCAQTPWLQSMSVRENILFSTPYDDVRYKRTLDACALTTDLANLKHGDLSDIGEKGIGLSGGQKARVALARALYSHARILFLDDPLSALDQQTAESIVAKVFGGDFVKGRTVILVTHRTDLCLGLAEQLVEITHGCARVCDDESAALTLSKSTSVPQSADDDHVELDKARDSAAVPEKFMEEEHRATGGVQARVYWQYIKAGKLRWWFFVVCGAAAFRLLLVGEFWFLKEWGEAYDKGEEQLRMLVKATGVPPHLMSSPISAIFDHFPDPGVNVRPWLVAYLLLVIAESFSYLLTDVFMLVVTYTAGRRMFRDIMQRVSNATFRFYDVTPVGRLMNRLTSDIGTIDGGIANHFLVIVWQTIGWLSSIIVIASITPIFLIFAVVLSLAFVMVFLRFLPASQSLRRLEMVSLSPLMSNFGALLDGLTTVRAFAAQSQFQDRVIEVTDTFQKMDHFYWSLQGWLMYRFENLAACSTFILTLLAVFSRLSPGMTAFVLAAASKFVSSTHRLCKQYGLLQMDFVSVERIVELLHLEQEPLGSIEPPAWWPSSSSEIVFEDVTIRYAPHLDPALRGISFTLKGGTNTAIIGRTGSGKSTLALALLATITPESGRILIDGIDIAKADKQALRNRITFLAQEPVLFPGSLRHNLDPTEEHADDVCEAVLESVCGSYGWTLQTQIDSGGRNLSQGQRQLVGLARAILRRSAVVIMDEATASIDKETAWEIQRVVREEMKSSTVITIAHRPSAVRDAEWCISLANGVVVAQGKPSDVAPAPTGGKEGI